MKKSMYWRAALSLILVAGLAILLSSCFSSDKNSATEEQLANREYMVQVNRIMDNLVIDLNGFNKAVADEDIVNMDVAADRAKKTIEELVALQAPEVLQEIHSEYVAGCVELRDALNQYIVLYTEISLATDERPFDFANYNAQINKIKQKYNSGIAHLESADQKARSME
ncbi:MAG: hypothetical protein FWE65_00825 [Eggerthellaceae bacterium]|nr:hypothetical protein [Eggerthellaceae bacterium]